MKARTVFFHLTCYYIVWLSCILSAAKGYYWLGPSIAALVSFLQWCWQKRQHAVRHLWPIVLWLTSLGFVVDTIFLQAHIIYFKANPWFIALSPPWMIAIWFNFSLLFYACLQGLFHRYVLLGVLSFIGFPLAYLAGVKLGAAIFLQGYWSALAPGIAWSLLIPITTSIYLKLFEKDGHYV